MRCDLPIEFRCQDDHVLAVARQVGLIEIAAVPDTRFAQKLKRTWWKTGATFNRVLVPKKMVAPNTL